ncbi:MAG: hypothetical protein FDZ69_13530 [Deltaproteobacteria bacterium]|nr:MAG: hypothetical protein FDZ69_13530 [Deltaproteobacteria bacterium]
MFLSPDAAGDNISVTLQAGQRIDIGRHDSGWTYAGFTDQDVAPTISGRLTGPDGLPREGLLVFAFTDREMTSEPLAVSEPSDAAGRYLLRLPEPATVYLRAREHYGRREPSAGGSMGIYGEDGPTAVTVPAGGDRQERNLSILLIPPSNERPTGIAGAGAAIRIEKTSSKSVDTKN